MKKLKSIQIINNTNMYLGIVKIIKEKLNNRSELRTSASEYLRYIKYERKSNHN